MKLLQNLQALCFLCLQEDKYHIIPSKIMNLK